MGKLGRKRTIIIKYGNFALPNELDGITYIDFSKGRERQGEANLKQILLKLKETTMNSQNRDNINAST